MAKKKTGDRFQGEATRTVHQWGCNSYKPPDVRYDRWGKPRFQDEPGRCDMIVWKGGRVCLIEVKDEYDSFPFANFEQSKRDYIAKYCKAAPYSTQAWLWLCLGTGQPQWKPEKRPRITWLVPIEAWYAVEEKVRKYQVSLPYLATKYYNAEMQEQKLDAVHLLKRFALEWKSGSWVIPPEHPFSKLYIQPEPIPLYRSEENKSEQRSSAIATPNPQRNHGSRRYVDYRLRGNDAGYGLARESLLYPRSDASIGNFERQDHTSHALLCLAGVV